LPIYLKALEDRLWDAADQLRANSHLKSSEYSVPVLGLIFLRYADVKFAHADEQLKVKFANRRRGITRDDYQELRVVLPKTYTAFDKTLLTELLKNFNSIPMDIEGDAFGKIYEYFLGKFAMSEGQKGGEFFTPTSLVRLIVEVIEPYHGRIYDPACGSGGMFVQSAKFVERHKKNPSAEISVYGQEKVAETVRLCKMNLAVHGLSGI